MDGVFRTTVPAKYSVYKLQNLFQDWKIFVEYDDANKVMLVQHYE